MSFQTNFDRELAFSIAQTLGTTADTASTSEINLGATGMGQATPVKGVVNVTALSGTLAIKVYGSTTATVTTSNTLIQTISVGSGVTGQQHFTLPQNCPQYIKLFYSAGTSGTVTSWLTAEATGAL